MKRSLVVGVMVLAGIALFAGETSGPAGQIPLCRTEGSCVFHLTMPEFEIIPLDNDEVRIGMPGVGYRQYPGHPRLPMPTYTFALPPGSEVVSVDVSGNRRELPGTYLVEASLPALPLGATNTTLNNLHVLYKETRARVYSGEEKLSDHLGEIHATGERREYSLVTVAVYPFAYDPVSGSLYFTTDVTVSIRYAPVSEEHAEFIARFIRKGTLYPDVPEHIYNKDEAREWYRPSERVLANPRMLILTTAALKDSTSLYRQWRRHTGFEVSVATVEDIAGSTSGVDLPQKIRNWLRGHAADYDYLLIIGHHANIPMRVLAPFNNGNAGWWPDLADIPSDIYYGDLSKPDEESWNEDGDSYYGEALSAGGFVDPQDAPDLEMELHVGRINSSFATTVPSILEQTWLFEYDKNTTYKETSVLAGGILWYPNENGGGYPGYDGAHYMELLMSNGIIKESRATTLYEKEGDGPSLYNCDVNFTQTNLKNTLANTDAGIFVENNHGWKNQFSRCVWHDDGDSIPTDNEFAWPTGLASTDAFLLNTEKPNVAFLLSCLNGYPEDANSLAQALLNYSSIAVVAHTRSALGRQGWSGPGDGGQNGLYYYVLNNYLKKTTYDHVLGDAVDAGRLQYYNAESRVSKYVNSYGHTLYGDPALRHFGREGNLPDPAVAEKTPILSPTSLDVDFENRISFSLPEPTDVRIEVWDAAGRKVQTLFEDHSSAGTHTLSWDSSGLPSGAYFITLRTKAITRTAKAVVIQ